VDLQIEHWMIEEAKAYAISSARYTSNRHDFHGGGLANKAAKMFEGKLGEKIFKNWMIQQSLSFDEDHTSHEEADDYDFCVADRTIDVKTFTKDFHKRLLEMVEQYQKNSKDYYVAVRIRFDPFTVKLSGNNIIFDFSGILQHSATIVGWASKADIGRAPVHNFGYQDDHWLWLDKLRDINTLALELSTLLRK
jgi:hypothetical protein